MLQAVRIAALALSLSCACGSPPAPPAEPEPPRAVEGVLRFEARTITPAGLSQELVERPARFLRVALVDGGGEVRAEGRTDEAGRFVFPEAPPEPLALRVTAIAEADGYRAETTTDRLGQSPHRFDLPLEGPGPHTAVAREAGLEGHAGALHIADTLLAGLRAVGTWVERPLPPIFAYWGRGVTTRWSFYSGEVPEGSGRFGLELLGGPAGQQATADTDEHDEGIVMHELFHFVTDRLSTNSSAGGRHPPGHLVEPGLAWEEGRVTFLAMAALGDPLYRDSIGIAPQGHLRVDADLETPPAGALRGLYAERSVSRILWDLADGTDPRLVDRDRDGIALGVPLLLEAMIAQRQVTGAYPCLASFLRFLVERGDVSDADLRAMLRATGEPPSLLDAVWPRPLVVGASTRDTIDGVTQPAPRGGPNLPTGPTAIHSYLLEVEAIGVLDLSLHIEGSGRAADRQDLDLELRDLRGDALQRAATEARVERLRHVVAPGRYVVRVVDGGAGNRAAYEVRSALEAAAR
jgi:hypothetical protein